MEAIAVGFVVLGGIGLAAGAVLGVVAARHGWSWWPAPALGVLTASGYALYAVAELRGCPHDECGESAYPLALVTAVTNAGTWVAAALGGFGFARRRS